MAYYFLLHVITGCICAFVAFKLNKSELLGFLCGIILGPLALFGLLFLWAFMPPTDLKNKNGLADIEYYAKQGKSSKFIARLLRLDQFAVDQACLKLLQEGKISEDNYETVTGRKV